MRSIASECPNFRIQSNTRPFVWQLDPDNSESRSAFDSALYEGARAQVAAEGQTTSVVRALSGKLEKMPAEILNKQCCQDENVPASRFSRQQQKYRKHVKLES